ncbi:hypothetical protein Fcan01_26580 [Folsomia candida]|uniref:Terpene synthase n=1 Tax=Folsomia candida TaxID=158441 RepID=A0A226CZB6_FOLCA|nr:hypothetical protein Fcan01_26580 [Folsomia candida]
MSCKVPILIEKNGDISGLPGVTYDLISGDFRGETLYPELDGAVAKLRIEMGPVKIPETGEIVQVAGDIPLIQKYSTRFSEKTTSNGKKLRKVGQNIVSHLAKFSVGDKCKVEKLVKSLLLYVMGGIPSDFEIPWDNLLPVVGVFVFGFLVDDRLDQARVGEGTKEWRSTWLRMAARIWSLDQCDVDAGDKLCHFLEDCNHGLRRMENFPGESEFARGAVKDWLLREGDALDVTAEAKTVSTYLAERRYTSGFRCSCEVMALSLHIVITPEQRQDPIFKELEDLWATLAGLVNDVYSLAKEIEQGEGSNYLLVAGKGAEFSNISTCLVHLLEVLLPEMIQNVKVLEENLLLKYDGDENLGNYFKLANNSYDAMVKWSPWSGRFGRFKQGSVTEEKTVAAYLVERRYTSGFRCSCEVMELSLHIVITLEQRQDPIFKELEDLWATLAGLVNDVYSLAKEIEQDEGSNYLLVAGRGVEFSNISTCLAHVLEVLMPEMIETVKILEEDLLLKYKRDENLRNYFKLANNSYDAMVKWSPWSGRFGRFKEGSISMFFCRNLNVFMEIAN